MNVVDMLSDINTISYTDSLIGGQYGPGYGRRSRNPFAGKSMWVIIAIVVICCCCCLISSSVGAAFKDKIQDFVKDLTDKDDD